MRSLWGIRWRGWRCRRYRGRRIAARYGLDPAKQWVALLPGSRWKEIAANLPAMLEVASCSLVSDSQYEFLVPVANTICPGMGA